MKFNVLAAAITGGIAVAIAIGFTGVVGMYSEGYGKPVLELFASVYPSYTASGGIGDLAIGCFWGAIDGMVGGGLLAWLYNYLSSMAKKA